MRRRSDGISGTSHSGNRQAPDSSLDRNLAYLSLVEVLHGYPIDGVVLTTGCDKTTPAMLMGAATADIPAIVLSGGPMLDGWWKGERVGSGTIVWESRRLLAEGKIDYEEFMSRVCASAPSLGHCNTMGTASTMNAMAEALGMSLTGCSAIPAPFRERMGMAHRTGKRCVEMVFEDLKPSKILTREAFENAIIVNSAIGGSTNAPRICRPSLGMPASNLMSRTGKKSDLTSPCSSAQPAAAYLGEGFFLPVAYRLSWANCMRLKLHGNCLTASGQSVSEAISEIRSENSDDSSL